MDYRSKNNCLSRLKTQTIRRQRYYVKNSATIYPQFKVIPVRIANHTAAESYSKALTLKAIFKPFNLSAAYTCDLCDKSNIRTEDALGEHVRVKH